jgi:hypothetical protein
MSNTASDGSYHTIPSDSIVDSFTTTEQGYNSISYYHANSLTKIIVEYTCIYIFFIIDHFCSELRVIL